MTRAFRLSLVFTGGLIFAVGLLLGQQIRRSKFDNYLRPATITSMDMAVLRANLDVIRSFMSVEVPTIRYDSSCVCFVAFATITNELTKEPLDTVRGRLMTLAVTARTALEAQFPELSKSGTVPDRDFKMRFFELNLQKPDESRDIAEYADGKIVFK